MSRLISLIVILQSLTFNRLHCDARLSSQFDSQVEAFLARTKTLADTQIDDNESDDDSLNKSELNFAPKSESVSGSQVTGSIKRIHNTFYSDHNTDGLANPGPDESEKVYQDAQSPLWDLEPFENLATEEPGTQSHVLGVINNQTDAHQFQMVNNITGKKSLTPVNSANNDDEIDKENSNTGNMSSINSIGETDSIPQVSQSKKRKLQHEEYKSESESDEVEVVEVGLNEAAQYQVILRNGNENEYTIYTSIIVPEGILYDSYLGPVKVTAESNLVIDSESVANSAKLKLTLRSSLISILLTLYNHIYTKVSESDSKSESNSPSNILASEEFLAQFERQPVDTQERIEYDQAVENLKEVRLRKEYYSSDSMSFLMMQKEIILEKIKKQYYSSVITDDNFDSPSPVTFSEKFLTENDDDYSISVMVGEKNLKLSIPTNKIGSLNSRIKVMKKIEQLLATSEDSANDSVRLLDFYRSYIFDYFTKSPMLTATNTMGPI